MLTWVYTISTYTGKALDQFSVSRTALYVNMLLDKWVDVLSNQFGNIQLCQTKL